MKKTLVALGSVLLAVLFTAVIFNVTGMLKMYNMPTTGNEPGLKQGSHFFASSLKRPKAGDFIVYNFNGYSYSHRLIGNSGDIVHIKNGTVFINGRNFDKNLSLKHAYAITAAEIGILSAKKLFTPESLMPSENGKYIVFLEDSIVKSNIPSATRFISSEHEPDNAIKKQFGKAWNKDFFGPFTIPEGKMFVLGDNRDNSEDSRYVGCINAADVKGTILK